MSLAKCYCNRKCYCKLASVIAIASKIQKYFHRCVVLCSRIKQPFVKKIVVVNHVIRLNSTSQQLCLMLKMVAAIICQSRTEAWKRFLIRGLAPTSYRFHARMGFMLLIEVLLKHVVRNCVENGASKFNGK